MVNAKKSNQKTKIKQWTLLLILILSTFCVYSNALFNKFVWDDKLIVFSDVVQEGNILSVFSPTAHHKDLQSKLYRPIRDVLFIFENKIAGNSPYFYHFISILLHILNVVIIFYILKKLTGLPAFSFIVTILWTLHPVNSETVYWVKNQGELLYVFFLFLAFYLFLKGQFFIPTVLFIFSLLSKETAVIFPFLIVLYLVLYKIKITRRHIIFVIVSLLIIGVRFAIIKPVISFEAPNSIIQQYSLAEHDFLVRIFTMAKVFLYYLYLAIFPIFLNADPKLAVVTGPVGAIYLIVTIVFILVAILLSRGHRLLVFFFLLFLIGLLPVNNIFYTTPRFVAEHYLYLPLVGLLAFAVMLIQIRFMPRAKKVLRLIFIIMLLIYGARTFIRATDWRDDISLWNSVLRYEPYNSRAYINLGNAAFDRQDYMAANRYFELARQKLEPVPVKLDLRLAMSYIYSGDIRKGIELLNKLLQHSKTKEDFLATYELLGMAYYIQGDRDSAKEYFKKAYELEPSEERKKFLAMVSKDELDITQLHRVDTDSQTYFLQAIRYHRLNQWDTALQYYRRALSLKFPLIYYNIGLLYHQQNLIDSAAYYYNQALAKMPGYLLALNNLGLVYQAKKQWTQAEKTYKRALNIDKTFLPARYNLGVLYELRGKYRAALAQYKKVLRYYAKYIKQNTVRKDINIPAVQNIYRRIEYVSEKLRE